MRLALYISRNQDVRGNDIHSSRCSSLLEAVLKTHAAPEPGRLRFAVHLRHPLKRHKSATRLVIIITINITVMRPNSFRRERSLAFYFKRARSAREREKTRFGGPWKSYTRRSKTRLRQNARRARALNGV